MLWSKRLSFKIALVIGFGFSFGFIMNKALPVQASEVDETTEIKDAHSDISKNSAESSGLNAAEANTSQPPSYNPSYNDGQMVFENGHWMYKLDNGSYLTDALRDVDGKTYYFDHNGYRATGRVKIDYIYTTYWFYFQDDGTALKSGWVGNDYFDEFGHLSLTATQNHWRIENGHWMYYKTEDEYFINVFRVIDGEIYLFDENGYMFTGWYHDEEDDDWYFFKDNGAAPRNTWIGDFYFNHKGKWVKDAKKPGWIFSNGRWWYLNLDGSYPFDQFSLINGHYYYFDNQGYMVTGWRLVNGIWYYFNPTGDMVTGWKLIANKWYFFNTEGVMLTGELTVNGTTYDFGSSGAMLTGWKNTDLGWKFYENSGIMAKSKWIQHFYFDSRGIWIENQKKATWVLKDNKWMYRLDDGTFVKNSFKNIEDKYYYFDRNGIMKTGWLSLQGQKYYFDASGAMKTGWFTLDGKKYYFGEGGQAYKSQWLDLDNSRYFFNSNGELQTGWIYLDGIYYANESGAIVRNAFFKVPGTGDNLTYFDQFGRKRTTDFVINQTTYKVDSNGYIIGSKINGVPYYNQLDPTWGDIVIGRGPIWQTACGVMTATSVINYLNHTNYSPVEVGKVFNQNNVYNALGTGTLGTFSSVMKDVYGLQYTANMTYDDVISALKMGKIVIVGVDESKFTRGSHAILLRGIRQDPKSGEFYVSIYDPWTASYNDYEHSLKYIWTVRSFWVGNSYNGGPIFAFSK